MSRYATQTVLAVGAHPDDAEIAIGGTLARLSRAGARAVIAVVSVPGHSEVRMAEARKAAEVLGAELVFLAQGACQRIEDVRHCEIVAMVDHLVREYAPAALFTHGPTEFHKDHLAVYEACQSTQRLAQFDFFCFNPTMCRPIAVPFHPRAYIDISSSIDVKMAAIAAHASQFHGREIDNAIFKDVARMQGRMVGVQYAEAVDVKRMLLT